MRLGYFLLFLLLISCGPGYKNKAFEKLSSADKIKFEKYFIQGRDLYKTNCLSCHQKNGQGLKKLIPPLAGSDYLKNNQAKAAQLIMDGAWETIRVNGVDYKPTMPAHKHLTALEVAEILTYINNSWGNEYGLVDGNKAAEYLKRF
ncbi:MAG: cytochrome c [Cyclobacteriaceae bacterium]|nr:cytochrome c [Cyclobacteriaceae bacterium]